MGKFANYHLPSALFMNIRLFTSLICTFLITITTQAQDTTLQRLLAAKTDTVVVKELIDYGISLADVDNKKAKEVLVASLQKSNSINYVYGIANSYYMLAYIEGQEGRYKNAIQTLLKTIPYLERINRIKGLIRVYNNIGVNYEVLGRTDSALHYYLKAIDLYGSKNTELDVLALLYENVGTLYGNFSQLDKALEYAQKSVALSREINDTTRLTTSLACLNYVYNQRKEYKDALRAGREARGLINFINDSVATAKVYSHISAAFVGMREPDSAIVNVRKALRIAETYDQALYVNASMNLVAALDQKKDYTQQKEVLLKMLKLIEANKSQLSLHVIYGRLAKVNYQLGNLKEAYTYSEKRNEAKDIYFGEKMGRDVADLEVKYQTALKEKALSEKQLQLAQRDLQLERSHQYINLAASGLVIVSLLATGIYIRFRNKRKIHISQMEALQKQKRIEMLEAAMQGEEKERGRIAKDLHDGVAGILAAAKMQLNSIAYNNPITDRNVAFTQAITLLDEAHQEVRKTSHNLMPEVLLKYGLNEALKRYCAAISNDSLQVHYTNYGETSCLKDHFELALYRIVQELLGNVIKHAKASQALVQLSTHEGCLLVEVQDNGIGFASASNLTSIGLQSLENRVQALNGSINFESSKSGLTVTLEFDITHV